MRFIHLADVHLADNSTFDNSLGHIIRENTWKSFEQIFINNKDTDFALIAGDLFERSFFSSKDFKNLFRIFEDYGKDIYYVTGNHDYFDEFNTIFLNNKPNNLHVFTEDNLSLFEKDGIRVYGLSYKDRIYKKDFNYDISLDKDFFNILLAHGDLSLNKTNYLDLDANKINQIGFDYVALGHIHKASNIYNIYYSGSIEPHDFSDTYDYGYILYENGLVSQIDSSLMKFNSIDINAKEFDNIDEIINNINASLSDKVNFVRLNLESNDDLNIDKIKKSINASYTSIRLSYRENFGNIAKLYPNSLLSKFENKFKDDVDPTKSRAREVGIEAILRSKK
ncbi:DNA repair exonuclease [Anaerococcus nagyae]|uniref:DNA repair exonuclease n=2 Tax=Anaerococcus TaxID=165779 RepID=A0A3E2TIF2_9FIRM|nr:DNA repair exonuclease [Anaerococcus nagyae]RGB76470.1 DNA repair exonuclease [Anaerococcus nagyae]